MHIITGPKMRSCTSGKSSCRKIAADKLSWQFAGDPSRNFGAVLATTGKAILPAAAPPSLIRNSFIAQFRKSSSKCKHLLGKPLSCNFAVRLVNLDADGATA